MKLTNIFLLILTSCSAFYKIPSIKDNLKCSISKNNYSNTIIKPKSYMKLIRYKNILPTFFLSLSGGILVNPIKIFSKTFIVSLVNTILIMSSSMVINDIYDIKIDKSNNIDRPLVSGEISKKEAIIFVSILIGLTEFLSIRFLPLNLQKIIDYSIIFINIYTPILKKIPLIKNISCALLVSFSIYFAGLSTNILLNYKNYPLFIITISLIFFGSLYNELLLDMRDYDGDRTNKIFTIPVLFGKKKAWNFINSVLNFNIILNTMALSYFYNFKFGLLLLLIFTQVKFDLYTIKKFNYSNNVIKKVIDSFCEPYYFLLFYIYLLNFLI